MKMIKPVETRTSIHKAIHRKPVNTESLEGMTADSDKMVRGTFINVEYPGQPAKVCGKFYKAMPYFSEVFEDGQSYTIPLSIARFINERIGYEQHSYILDEQGNPIKSQKKVPRYKFTAETF